MSADGSCQNAVNEHNVNRVGSDALLGAALGPCQGKGTGTGEHGLFRE